MESKYRAKLMYKNPSKDKTCYFMEHHPAGFNGGLNPCGFNLRRGENDICTRRNCETHNQFPKCDFTKPPAKQIQIALEV